MRERLRRRADAATHDETRSRYEPTRIALRACSSLLGRRSRSAPARPPRRRRRRRRPTFKVQVDYVEVDALVTDQQGSFVRDLKKEDFQVLEDGKPQTISTFSLVDIPIERAERPLVRRAARSSRTSGPTSARSTAAST